jgi:putative membrane protein
MKIESALNKDLILRENLAIERTDMAIDRTLLSFVRTALYFAIAGMTINSVLHLSYGLFVEIVFWVLSVIILSLGFYKYVQQKRKLRASKKHIGNYKF